MMLNSDSLFNRLYSLMSDAQNADGSSFLFPVLKAFCEELIISLKASQMFHATGTVNGFGVAMNAKSPPFPYPQGTFFQGTAIGGHIVNMQIENIVSRMIFEGRYSFPEVDGVVDYAERQTRKYCEAIRDHIYSGLINFSLVTGSCTMFEPEPSVPFPGAIGALVGSAAQGGVLAGLSGEVCTELITQYVDKINFYGKYDFQKTELMVQFHAELVNYIMENITLSYSGEPTGVFPIAYSFVALTGGTASGGLIQ